MSLNFIVNFLREARGKFPRGNIPRDSTGKRGRNIHIENSPSFPQGNYEDNPLEFPHKSAWKSGGGGWLARMQFLLTYKPCMHVSNVNY